jgi:uncharacterized membrane protein YphA (DoxX/SURF4 family)
MSTETISSGSDTASDQPFRYVRRCVLVILRVHLGVILLITVVGKMFRPEPFSVEMLNYLQGFSMRNAPGFYKIFLQQVVIPQSTLFSYLIITGEVVAGVCLLLGLCTRVGALIAMFLFLNYMFSKGGYFWSPDSEDAAVFFSALVCFLGAAGRVYGLDSYFARRRPETWIW